MSTIASKRFQTISNRKQKAKENLREEQNLDGNRQPRMQHHDQDQQDLTRPHIGRAQHGVQVPQEEEHRPPKAHADQRPVERRQRAPADQRDGDPDQVRVAVQRPALDQVGAGGAEPAQRTPQRDGQHEGVAVDEARRARKQAEVVLEVLLVVVRQVLRDGARQEEDDDHRGRDPEGPVQVRVAVHHVEEVGPRVQRGRAPAQHLVRVHVEVLRVVVDRPEADFGRRVVVVARGPVPPAAGAG